MRYMIAKPTPENTHLREYQIAVPAMGTGVISHSLKTLTAAAVSPIMDRILVFHTCAISLNTSAAILV